MGFEDQLKRIADRDELHRYVTDMADDEYGIIITASLSGENKGIHGFGTGHATMLLGLLAWGKAFVLGLTLRDDGEP